MNPMLIILISVLVASSVTTGIPSGGSIPPDHPLHPIDLFVEDIEVGIGGVIFGAAWRTNRLADISDERLGEAYEMLDHPDEAYAVQSMSRFTERVQEMRESAEGADDAQQLQLCNEVATRQMAVIEHMMQQTTRTQTRTMLMQSSQTCEQAYNQTRTRLHDYGITRPEEPPLPSVNAQQRGSD